MADFPPDDCRSSSDHAPASQESGTDVQDPISEAEAAAIVAQANAASAAVDRAALAFVRAWQRWQNAQDRANREIDRLDQAGRCLQTALDGLAIPLRLPLLVGRAVIYQKDNGRFEAVTTHHCRPPKD